MIPEIKEIEKLTSKISSKKPIVIITPVNRYLGFSAPISPVDQFTPIAEKWGVPILFKDPQRILISLNKDSLPELYDEDGLIEGSAFFPFGHDLLDRNMVKLIICALEKKNAKLVNGSKALTISDDKALIAIELANSGIPSAKSVIASARGNVPTVLQIINTKSLPSDHVIIKTSGFSAGGVGTQPIGANIDYMAPLLWGARMDYKPRIIQNDIDGTPPSEGRSVVRAYIVGGDVVGCYTTNGFGLVNCAGLTRESIGERYVPSLQEKEMYLKAANVVGAQGFCRVDASGGKNKAIFEINPLARIDAEKYGLNIPEEILWYCIKLACTQ